MSSSASATVAVDKATSDLLLGPDWTMNMEICDSVNSNHWEAKDVVKAVKRRLQHKSSRVQLLALTLLETLVKNCGEYLHFQIAEKNILGEMVKIVKKKADMQVRSKILVLLDSWQEAFGGPMGKYPQYYWAYEDLRQRSGVEFPRRSMDAAPIITPPASHPTLGQPYVGYGMPSGSLRRLDDTMANDVENLSLSSLDSMRDVMDLLNDMLQAVDPSDHTAVRDEVIVDLVERCRSNQKRLMQMLTSAGDEDLLARGLELNDSLQALLAKHDAIASGSPLPFHFLKPADSSPKSSEAKDSCSGPGSSIPAVAIVPVGKSPISEEDEEEDEFAQLARRHSKPTSVPADNSSASQTPRTPDAAAGVALVPVEPPSPVKTTKQQDIIDLLSITLSTPSTPPPPSPQPPPATSDQIPISSGSPEAPQNYPGDQGQMALNSYVVPWARQQQQPPPQTQLHPQLQPHLQTQSQPELQGYSPQVNHALPQSQFQAQPRPRPEPQPYSQLQMQPPTRPLYTQYSYGYPPPPWADNSSGNQMNSSASGNVLWNPRANMNDTYTPTQSGRSLQYSNSFPTRISNGTNATSGSGTGVASVSAGPKPFVPSYRLFEELNVFGKGDGRDKPANSSSPSLSGSQAHGMIGGKK